MTSYIDVIIPLVGGLAAFFYPEILIKNRDATYERRSRILKMVGIVLVAISIAYFIIKKFESG